MTLSLFYRMVLLWRLHFYGGLYGLSLANEETAGDPPRIQKECVIWPEVFAARVRSGVIAENKKR